MINVIYHRKHHRLTVEGHALSGEPGQDLVCASASILTYTLAASVANMAEQGQVRDPKIELEIGNATIACNPHHNFKAVATFAFDTVCAGFELLARDYPKNIVYEIMG